VAEGLAEVSDRINQVVLESDAIAARSETES
jgi:hypothetical protein